MMRAVPQNFFYHFRSIAPLIVTLTACDPSNNSPTRSLTISTITTPTPTEHHSGASGGTLTFATAQVVLRKVMLAPADSTCDLEEPDTLPDTMPTLMSTDGHGGDHKGDHEGDGDEADEKGCAVLKVGPLTVDLPLDTTTALVL